MSILHSNWYEDHVNKKRKEGIFNTQLKFGNEEEDNCGPCWDCGHQSGSHTSDTCHVCETCYYASKFEGLGINGDWCSGSIGQIVNGDEIFRDNQETSAGCINLQDVQLYRK